MEIKIRDFNYSYKDAISIKKIDQSTFNDCKYSEEEIIEIAGQENNKIFLAELDNKAVGFISLIKVQTLHYKGMWVDLIAVHPDYQGRGIGQNLLNKAKDYGALLDIKMISGLVANNNLSSRTALKKQGYDELEKDYRLYIFHRQKI